MRCRHNGNMSERRKRQAIRDERRQVEGYVHECCHTHTHELTYAKSGETARETVRRSVFAN